MGKQVAVGTAPRPKDHWEEVALLCWGNLSDFRVVVLRDPPGRTKTKSLGREECLEFFTDSTLATSVLVTWS